MSETMDSAQLLGSLEGLGWGPHHRERATHVLAVAQERGDLDLEFGARMALTAEGAMSGIGELALTNFAWCAAKHKEDPARFVSTGFEAGDTIFWQYKWMPGIICRNSIFDLDQLEEVFKDFEETYRAAGLPLSALVTARLETAIKTGRLDQAEQWATQLAGMRRDDYSSCKACLPSNSCCSAMAQTPCQTAARHRAIAANWLRPPPPMCVTSARSSIRPGRLRAIPDARSRRLRPTMPCTATPRKSARRPSRRSRPASSSCAKPSSRP